MHDTESLMQNFLKIFLVFIFSCNLLLAQEYWLKQSSPTHKNLATCFFTDTLNGWIGGDSGLILYTSDNGQNWIKQNSRVNDEIVSLFFVNNRIGYGLALEFDFTPPNFNGSRILSTSDGGNTWNNYLYPDTNLFLNSIFFLDSIKGFMAGSHGKLFYTNNSGSDWTEGVIDSGFMFAFPVEKIKFYNSMTGFASGGAFDIAGVMWRSTNGGRNWISQIVGPEPVNDFHIFDSFNILGVGGDFEYGASKVRSTNGGVVWNYNELGVFGIANSIGFRTNTEAWSALGIIDSFLLSTNKGENWRLVGTPGGTRINDLVFINSTHGWAVGKEGAILKYNSNVMNVENEISNLPSAFVLYQNYPNPFNPETNIRFELPAAEFVTLKVFDIQGKEIKTLISGDLSPGRYEIEFAGTDYPSGIYYYRLETGEQVLTKRMMLIK